MLHPHHIEGRTRCQEQAGVSVTPAERCDGALQQEKQDRLKRMAFFFQISKKVNISFLYFQNQLFEIFLFSWLIIDPGNRNF